MRIFVRKLLLFLVFPAIFLVAASLLYIYADPFAVIYGYNDYSEKNVSLDYVSTEVFDKNMSAQHYNSFIFGSSRTLAYNPQHWVKHLATDTLSAIAFVYAAYSEQIEGIAQKLDYIDQHNANIRNALIVIDGDVSFGESAPNPDFISAKHPKTGGKSWISFHFLHFKTFLSPRYITAYIACNIFGSENLTFRRTVENHTSIHPTTNHIRLDYLEAQIKANPDYFAREELYDRNYTDSVYPQAITAKHIAVLQKIEQIFAKHKTNYRIIISPLYNQIVFNPKDRDILQQIFGPENVYDFSGTNRITRSKYNYYEDAHYRPSVGDSIMDVVYGVKTWP